MHKRKVLHIVGYTVPSVPMLSVENDGMIFENIRHGPVMF